LYLEVTYPKKEKKHFEVEELVCSTQDICPIVTASLLSRKQVHCYQWKWLNILGRELDLQDRFYI